MSREEKRNVVEWVAFALGTLLTLTVAGFLLVEAFDGPHEIRVSARLTEARRTAEGIEVPVHVHNAGGAAAVDVQVEVCDAAGECLDLLFPQVPSEGDREAVAIFPPTAGAFTVRIVSYRGMNGGM
jgi:uncharacterized protein (TIGR02588 family)